MIKAISGASNVTEFQLVKFSQTNGVYQDEILSLYIKYALVYNVEVDIAYLMCLIYTDFFKNEIIDNNIVGIGTQCGGTKLESFNSIEDCIIAHYEILQKISTDLTIENHHSNLYRRVSSKSCIYSDEAFELFDYTALTNYSIYEFNIFLREINRTRREEADWTSTGYYYYIRVKTSKSKQELICLRSDLINKKFDKKNLFISADNGLYTLEAGRYTSPINTNTVLKNLKMYGYNGEIEFKRLT